MSILTNFLGKRKRGLLTPEEDEPGGILGQIGSYMPQIDPDTQGAIDEYASMPEAPKKSGMFGGDPGQFFGNLASSLGQAGAYWSGDWDVAESIGQSRAKQMQEQAELAAAARQREQIGAALRAQGLTDEQAMLAMNKMANIGDFKPKRELREDNAGNLWSIGEDGTMTPFWVDPNDKMTPMPGADGVMRYSAQPNALRGSAFERPVGKLTPVSPEEEDQIPGGPTRPASGGFRTPPRFRR